MYFNFKEMTYFQAISSETRSQTFVSFSVGLGHVQGNIRGLWHRMSQPYHKPRTPSCVNESERRKTYAHALTVSANRIEVSVKSRTTGSTEISGKKRKLTTKMVLKRTTTRTKLTKMRHFSVLCGIVGAPRSQFCAKITK